MANLRTILDIVERLYNDMTNYSTMIYQVINSIYYRSFMIVLLTYLFTYTLIYHRIHLCLIF